MAPLHYRRWDLAYIHKSEPGFEVTFECGELEALRQLVTSCTVLPVGAVEIWLKALDTAIEANFEEPDESGDGVEIVVERVPARRRENL